MVYYYYAIMHRTTIVQNKIISIICSCLFFCLVNIYRPSLRKVRLDRPNPNPSQSLNIYLRRKKKITQNCMHYNASSSDFQFSFIFSIFLYFFQKCVIQPVKILTIYVIIIN